MGEGRLVTLSLAVDMGAGDLIFAWLLVYFESIDEAWVTRSVDRARPRGDFRFKDHSQSFGSIGAGDKARLLIFII